VPERADDEVYLAAVRQAVEKAKTFSPDVLVIALGLDLRSPIPSPALP
jgi:acetoin utilization deacetylase AcuC-like enzyme